MTSDPRFSKKVSWFDTIIDPADQYEVAKARAEISFLTLVACSVFLLIDEILDSPHSHLSLPRLTSTIPTI